MIGDEHVDELFVVPMLVPVDDDDDVLLRELFIVSYISVKQITKKHRNLKIKVLPSENLIRFHL